MGLIKNINENIDISLLIDLLTSGDIEQIDLAYMLGHGQNIDIDALIEEIYYDIFTFIGLNERQTRFLQRQSILLDDKESKVKHKLLYIINRKSWSVSGKDLLKIPKTIGYLTNTEVLFINNNKLTKLPESFSNLKLLYKLNLVGNNFSEIPEVLYSLSDNLNFLYFNDNSLKVEQIQEMQQNLPNTLITS
jgi:Leucine-rich repeat (LRR) protein